jgi:hypothetical protein
MSHLSPHSLIFEPLYLTQSGHEALDSSCSPSYAERFVRPSTTLLPSMNSPGVSTRSPQSMTGTIRSYRTLGPSSASSLGSPFSVADSQYPSPEHHRIGSKMPLYRSVAPSGSFLDMHPSPHSPLISLPDRKRDEATQSYPTFLKNNLTFQARESLETTPQSVLLAKVSSTDISKSIQWR